MQASPSHADHPIPGSPDPLNPRVRADGRRHGCGQADATAEGGTRKLASSFVEQIIYNYSNRYRDYRQLIRNASIIRLFDVVGKPFPKPPPWGNGCRHHRQVPGASMHRTCRASLSHTCNRGGALAPPLPAYPRCEQPRTRARYASIPTRFTFFQRRSLPFAVSR
jgi:hypothetical protein